MASVSKEAEQTGQLKEVALGPRIWRRTTTDDRVISRELEMILEMFYNGEPTDVMFDFVILQVLLFVIMSLKF